MKAGGGVIYLFRIIKIEKKSRCGIKIEQQHTEGEKRKIVVINVPISASYL